MSTRLRFALFLAGTALIFVLATDARATNYVVDRADDPPGAFLCQTAVANDCTFRYAISLAAPGDQVHFAANLVGATIVLNDTINLLIGGQNTGPTDIDGSGTNFVTIKYPAGYIFTVTDDNIRNFKGIRFADSAGGFLSPNTAQPSNINLDQVRFDNVGIPISGKANSTYALSGSTVTGSGNIINAGPLFLTGVNFSNGQTRALINSGVTRIIGSSFSGYHMPDPGGAIYNSGTVNIFGSNFSSNSSAQGGAIYSQPGSTLYIDGGTYSGNQALIGGAVCSDLATATIINATFTGNIAGQDGGAIIAGGTAQFLHLTISGNSAAQNGGGIDLFSSTPAYARHLTVYNNHANNRGGGIYAEGGAPNIANTIIAGNTAGAMFPDTNASALSSLIGGDPKLMSLGNYGGSTQTHALKCGSPARDTGSAALSTDVAGFALAFDQRGAGYDRNANGTVDMGAVEIVYAQVTNNLDGALDAGSFRKTAADLPNFGEVCFDPAYFNVPQIITQSNATLLLDHSLIVEGPGSNLLTLDAHGASRNVTIAQTAGLVYLSGVSMINGGFSASDPRPGTAGALLVDGFDGNQGGSSLVASDLILNGTGTVNRLGLYNKGTLTLADSTIDGWSAGGFYNEKGATLNRVTITNNTSTQGAGIMNDGGTLTITDSTLRFNHAAYPAGQSGSEPRGGAIFNGNASYLYLRRSLVANNTAQLGGGLHNFGYAELRNVTMTSNSALQTGNGPAANGGAIYADGNYVGTSMATIDIYNSTIAGNGAVNSGGGTFMKQIPGSFAVMNFVNSIEALNNAPNGPDASGEIISYGYNLIGKNSGMSWAANSPSLTGNLVGAAGSPIDPKFAVFGDYGGPTQMLVLLPNSPAINAADPNFYEPTDQRGAARPLGGRADIGAFERNIAIDQATLINGVKNVPYLNGIGAQLSASRQTSFAPEGRPAKQGEAVMAPMQFTVAPAGGSLPPGLTLSPSGLLSGTPTTAGNFTFSIKATDTDGQAGVQQYTMQIFVPTAAGVSLSGRVVNAAGAGISGVQVTLTATDGSVRSTVASSFGYYRFDDVPTGTPCILSAATKRYEFNALVVAASGNLTGLDLIAEARTQ
jgi:predicted outer membrane repeat protein